jgi:hypothetical protein
MRCKRMFETGCGGLPRAVGPIAFDRPTNTSSRPAQCNGYCDIAIEQGIPLIREVIHLTLLRAVWP